MPWPFLKPFAVCSRWWMSRTHPRHSGVQSRIPVEPAPVWSWTWLPRLGQVGKSNLSYLWVLYSAALKVLMTEMSNMGGEREEKLFSGWFFRNLWLRGTLSSSSPNRTLGHNIPANLKIWWPEPILLAIDSRSFHCGPPHSLPPNTSGSVTRVSCSSEGKCMIIF